MLYYLAQKTIHYNLEGKCKTILFRQLLLHKKCMIKQLLPKLIIKCFFNYSPDFVNLECIRGYETSGII